MSISTVNNSLSLFIALLLSGACLAQKQTTVRITADRNQILIGEQIRVILEADIPENQPIRFFQLDSLPHFEVVGKEKIDTSNTGSGTVLKQVIRITSFDSGHWVIPAIPLVDTIRTDTIPVDVGYTPFDSKQPYNDIKDIIEVQPKEEKRDDKWWYIGGGAVLLLAILYLLLRKKKKPVVIVVAPPIDPYKEAMDELTLLESKKPAAKEYYSKLVDIFRVYVEKRKGIHSLQNTSDDLVVQLRSIGLDSAQFAELEKGLRLSDFVKFAKYVPSGDDDNNLLKLIREVIRSIEQLK